MKNRVRSALTGFAALAVVAGASAGALAAESMTVNAFATYEGEGKIYLTGEKAGTFVGAIKGPLFVETDKGPRPVGNIVCPGMLLVNLENGEQSGTGQCTITGFAGGKVFAAWSCKGLHLLGCDGRMILTGGSGNAAGVTGSGPITVRTTDRALVKRVSEPESVTTLGSGIMVMRGLKLDLP